jgi:hypothetical protein
MRLVGMVASAVAGGGRQVRERAMYFLPGLTRLGYFVMVYLDDLDRMPYIPAGHAGGVYEPG